MDDLISRKHLMDYTLNQKSRTIDCNDIARFPAVEAEPVKHGRWQWMGLWEECSNCGHAISVDDVRTPYCPACGAKMDLEQAKPQKSP